MLQILHRNLKEGKNWKTFLASQLAPDMQHFSHCSQYAKFSQLMINAYIFNFCSELDILMKVFESYIILLISAGWLLLNFYLLQKQRFSVWSFAEITSFIFFHEEILSIANNTKKCWFQLGNFKYNKNKTQKLKQNLLTQWILWFTAIHFFNGNQAVRKTSSKNKLWENLVV